MLTDPSARVNEYRISIELIYSNFKFSVKSHLRMQFNLNVYVNKPTKINNPWIGPLFP